ncbi:3-isopropylmalate dehydratase [Actimicrobium sp. CCI2.3]|uniref:LeuD/DmdB family oxidoreductase small subunit n=1 Tax=Actimicrobium sp. CCI2.3 TaxID=3048616 RepID=UPI002AB4A9B4|nr:3-isopropylmalate dehydratase [Actimicrobium sp. CCI2.3]MDY7574394.1 3-isopropylmalate dehydratase [Actimicrobium sp. CCI2.3]MEB0022527.1 3-isopropylmalate dehydratase [Actimicrobium sp. CCI2.3]
MSSHRVWKLGADIDTDALAPGAYMKLGIDGIAPHCLEAVRPEFASEVRPGDVIVAGANFGIGSSREQAAAALVRLGVRAVIAPSFSGLFFRNAFNLGLLLLTVPQATVLDEAELVTLDLTAMTLTSASGKVFMIEPIPEFLRAMVDAGGLLNQLRLRQGAPA